MVPQRFHGVFSQLLKEQGGVSAAEEQEDSSVSAPSTSPGARKGQIAVDVYEDAGYIVIKAPIAGVKLADLDIDVSDNVVTIRGERRQGDDLSEANMLIEECYWGSFERKVTLPYSVNPSKVKATFSKDNILKVLFPKEEKKIKIVKINEGG
jgi:HSP20 family protein